MRQLERSLWISFQIDANRINARRGLPDMNQLEKWKADGVILIEMSEVAQKEAIAGGDRRRVEKALGYIYSETYATHPDDPGIMKKIEEIMFPLGANNQNEKNDVEILFNARKYGTRLITADGGSNRQPGGMRGHKDELRILGIEILTDTEAVAFIREKIKQRDKNVLFRHEKMGLEMPEWYGKD